MPYKSEPNRASGQKDDRLGGFPPDKKNRKRAGGRVAMATKAARPVRRRNRYITNGAQTINRIAPLGAVSNTMTDVTVDKTSSDSCKDLRGSPSAWKLGHGLQPNR